MSKFLPDTNVFSKIFGNDLSVKQLVENLDAVIDATIYIQCLQVSKSNHEKRVIEKYLTRFPLLQITSQSSVTAIELIQDDKINAVRYISPDDIYINYYEWEYMNEKNSNLYFKYGDSIFQDKTTERLKSFLDSIDKVQAKLISLGATKKVAVRKK
ncbi:MAG: hypothetical protein ACR2MD_03255 [Aridibacter sp.]